MSVSTFIVLAVVSANQWVPAEPGVKVGEPIELSLSGSSPAVVFDGAEFVVGWIERAEKVQAPACVMLAAVPGGPNKPPQPAPKRLACSERVSAGPALASSPIATVVVWGEGDAVVGTAFKGGERSPTFRIAAGRNPYYLRVAFDGSRFVIAWADYQKLHTLRLSADGQLIDESPVAIAQGGQSSLDESSLACGGGRCLAVYRMFHGNSRTSAAAVVLSGGLVEKQLGLSGNPFSIAATAGSAGKLLAILSSYDRMWLSAPLEPDEKPFVVEAEHGERIRDLAAAGGEAGMLVAWTRERTPGGNDAALLYVHPSPGSAQPGPLNLRREFNPAVATADGKTFLVVTESRASGMTGNWPRLVARRVAANPGVFARAPVSRPPVATGTVLSPDGRPAPGAQVSFDIALRNGQRTTGTRLAAADGSFVIAHPRPDDHRPEFDVVAAAVVWAQRDGEVSDVHRFVGQPLTVKLKAAARLAVRVDAPAQLTVWVLSPTYTMTHQNVIWTKQVELPAETFELDRVATGPVLIEARGADRRAAFISRTLAPGESASVELKLEVRGSLELWALDPRTEQPWPTALSVMIMPGSGLEALQERLTELPEGGMVHLEGLIAGEQKVMLWNADGFEATHTVRVRSGQATSTAVPFKVALPPGKVGLLLAAGADGSVMVKAVVPGSPAQVAGVSEGDVVLAVGGKAPRSAAEAIELLGGQPGSEVRVRLRGAKGERDARLVRSK